jgi:signal peptidase II
MPWTRAWCAEPHDVRAVHLSRFAGEVDTRRVAGEGAWFGTLSRFATLSDPGPSPGQALSRKRERCGLRGMTRNRVTTIGLIAVLVVLAADQLSKWWILTIVRLEEVGQIVLLPVLNLTMVWNRGVTFGLLNGFGQWGSLILAAVALAVVVALGVWLRRAESGLVAAALGAIAGGAISNVIDRLRFGAVVDFIHAHIGNWSWYVFNVADAAIVCGVLTLVLDSLLPRGRQTRSPGDTSPG